MPEEVESSARNPKTEFKGLVFPTPLSGTFHHTCREHGENALHTGTTVKVPKLSRQGKLILVPSEGPHLVLCEQRANCSVFRALLEEYQLQEYRYPHERNGTTCFALGRIVDAEIWEQFQAQQVQAYEAYCQEQRKLGHERRSQEVQEARTVYRSKVRACARGYLSEDRAALQQKKVAVATSRARIRARLLLVLLIDSLPRVEVTILELVYPRNVVPFRRLEHRRRVPPIQYRDAA